MDKTEHSIGILKLPNEILLHIFSYLDGFDLLSCRAVSPNWEILASDGFLWQTKLCELFGQKWSVMSCEEKSNDIPDLSDLNSISPCEVYQFLANYVPRHLLSEQDGFVRDSSTELDSNSPQQFLSINRPSLGNVITNWWHNVVRRLSLNVIRRNNNPTSQQYRFAVFGPGFDQRATSRLFSKLIDTRTKSFEPVEMIPGRMGFGAGLTLKLFAQAQYAVYDPSLKPPYAPTSPKPMDSPKSARRESEFVSDGSKTRNGISHIPGDLIFDLHYLFSLRGHLSQTFDSQLERILRSRLFQHPSPETPLTDKEVLETLEVTEGMQAILNSLNGIIYALDARETLEQSQCLYNELHSVIRGLPSSIAHRVPIVILYIMPKENISLKPHVQRRSFNASNTGSNNNPMTVLNNRDSYSGIEYTVSWLGSLLLPVSCLRLFQLENPWRLQKCASNDIRAVIQSIMWIRARAPSIPVQIQQTMGRSNSTI